MTATLSAESQVALDQGNFKVLVHSVSGPSGAMLFGRFCHADPKLQACVRSHLRAEEAIESDVEFAEIVHLPEGRVGNVLVRPVLREYEIPYLGWSELPIEQQFPITDLALSVQAGRIRLRSMRTGREIVPRLTSAHNYSWGSLGVYRFLGMLQHQEATGCPPWDWGVLATAPFLPRVTIGRLILSLARWHFSKDELLVLAQPNNADRFRAMQRLRVAKKLPRLIALADFDNLLPVDLDNVLSVESFIQLIKDREEVTIKEVFPGPAELCAYGPEGRFVHELIVPFIRNRKTNDSGRRSESIGGQTQVDASRYCAQSAIKADSTSPINRKFPPGSEWLYAKVYTGTATADAVLKNTIRPLTESLMKSGVADQWFFIRYADPEWHLRLRFHGTPDKLQQEALPEIQTILNRLLDNELVWRMQFDTYEREIERYGGAEGIVLAEQLFYFDSEAALEILEMLEPGDAGADERWRLAFCGIDRLLTDLGFDLHIKRRAMKQVRDVFGKEFRVDKTLQSQLGEKYRQERKSLEDLFNPAHDQESSLSPGLAVFRQRSERFSPSRS